MSNTEPVFLQQSLKFHCRCQLANSMTVLSCRYRGLYKYSTFYTAEKLSNISSHITYHIMKNTCTCTHITWHRMRRCMLRVGRKLRRGTISSWPPNSRMLVWRHKSLRCRSTLHWCHRKISIGITFTMGKTTNKTHASTNKTRHKAYRIMQSITTTFNLPPCKNLNEKIPS